MYYESRIYHLHPVKDATEAGTLLFNHSIPWDKVPTWTVHNDMQMFAVTDGCLDSMWDEIAVLRRDGDSLKKVESLTLAWIKPVEKFINYLKDCECAKAIGNANLNIGLPHPSKTAAFICGCCGSWFNGSIVDQQQYGQDAGYGICDKCNHYYK